jgi:hypothetical protein
MAVIINDFEVVVEQPAPVSNASAGGQPQNQQQAGTQLAPPRPHDIELVSRHFKKRHERLIAD